MEAGLLAVFAVGFFLGIKHAIEPDHIIAVSTIASESDKWIRSSLAGVYWGIGHTATLFLVGISFIVMKGSIPETWAMSLEFLVGVMLVYLGIQALIFYKKQKEASAPRKNSKSMFIGFIHGLAGSGAMIIATMSMVDSIVLAGVYILIFGVGTVVGMLLFTTLLGIPFMLTKHKEKLNHRLVQVTGAVSLVFGVYYMYGLGIEDGLFQLWFS
ncbi:HupE/UreJ family protein [Salimicrobium halophilum]|uniref:Cytochrome C biogenesis protein transmembrane region n=1 Tax=Salimicrobium halophilum TaxID=86666 RepID=A0A1G8RJH2_9BACI|nr:urease accessory protein UreH [Salimicrobium halophilum]SDJ17127.1 hypothetical protein SAMN04490247_1073 [Salimicrobium halophilum]